MVRHMDAGKQALRATWPVSIRGNPSMRVGLLYPFLPEVKKSSMPQSVKECFTQDDTGTELHPGARASASARGDWAQRARTRDGAHEDGDGMLQRHNGVVAHPKSGLHWGAAAMHCRARVKREVVTLLGVGDTLLEGNCHTHIFLLSLL